MLKINFFQKYLFHLKIFLLTQQTLSKIIHISIQPAFVSLFLFSRLHSLGVPVAKGCGNALFYYLKKWTTYQRQGDKILTSLFYSCHSFLSKFWCHFVIVFVLVFVRSWLLGEYVKMFYCVGVMVLELRTFLCFYRWPWALVLIVCMDKSQLYICRDIMSKVLMKVCSMRLARRIL